MSEGYINLVIEFVISFLYNLDIINWIYIVDFCFYIYMFGIIGLLKVGIFRYGWWMKFYGGFGVMVMCFMLKDVMYFILLFYYVIGLCVCWGLVIVGVLGFVIWRKFSVFNFWCDVWKYNVIVIGYVGELCCYFLD